MKAIDTRLKEIKLTKAVMEETSEVMLVDLKKKNKSRPTIDRNKRKMQEKFKEPREKRFISKRKLKDEFPELQEVEDKFFEIVKKVIIQNNPKILQRFSAKISCYS